MLALETSLQDSANSLTVLKCVVTTAVDDDAIIFLIIATASAAPSSGSVPSPTSSKSTSERSFMFDVMRARFFTCAENVLNDCVMLCESPISQNISSKTLISLPSSAGINIPHIVINANSPTVLSATVFPPVFGPDISKIRSLFKHISTGITDPVGISGWRAPLSVILPTSFVTGRQASIFFAYSAFANITPHSVKTS